jgi:hypothetical protein
VRRRIGSLALVAAAGCWRAGPLRLELRYDAAADEPEVAPAGIGCRIAFATVADARPEIDRQSVGDRGGAVTAEHVPEWVCQGLQTLVRSRLATAACVPAPAAPDLVATVAIRRLYVHAVATDLEAVLALDVRYTRRDGDSRDRAYRGSAQVFNWFNGDGEIEGVVNQALRDSVVQIAGELRNACSGTLPARHTW